MSEHLVVEGLHLSHLPVVAARGPELSEEVELARRAIAREDRELRAGIDVARREALLILTDQVAALHDRLDEVLSSPGAQHDLDAAWSAFLVSGDLDAAARALAGRLRAAFEGARKAYSERELQEVAQKGQQIQFKLLELVRKGRSMTREDVLALTEMLEDLAGTEGGGEEV